jgi:hypothetical protein
MPPIRAALLLGGRAALSVPETEIGDGFVIGGIVDVDARVDSGCGNEAATRAVVVVRLCSHRLKAAEHSCCERQQQASTARDCLTYETLLAWDSQFTGIVVRKLMAKRILTTVRVPSILK